MLYDWHDIKMLIEFIRSRSSVGSSSGISNSVSCSCSCSGSGG